MFLFFPSPIPCIQSISKSCHSRLQNLSQIKFFLTTPLCHSIPSSQATVICHIIYRNHLSTGFFDLFLTPHSLFLTQQPEILSKLNHVCLWHKIFFFFFFSVSWATPEAYGGSQARGQIGAVAASLCQSHSNMGSQPLL